MGFEILGLNLVTTAGILGAVLLVLGFMKMYKSKGTKKIATIFGIGLVALFLATAFVGQLQTVTWLTSDWNTKPASVGDTGTTVGGELPKTGSCLGIEDTTVTLSASDKYTGSATGGTHRYKVNNGIALTVSDAGTITASPGDVLDILVGNASVTDKFFGKVLRTVVPCQGTFRVPGMNVVQNETSALDVDFYNRDGNKMDSGENKQVLNNDDIKTVKLRWMGASDKGYPYGVLAVFEYNSTAFDKIEVIGATKSSTPNFYTVGATSRTTSAYLIPGIEDVTEVEYLVNVDASGNGPQDGTGTTNMSSGVNVTFYPLDYYIDEDNGGTFAGPAVEDEDNVKTFPHTASVVNIFFE